MIKGKRICCLAGMILCFICTAMLAGCQETPKESAVVSKADGFSEDRIAVPLAEGETQKIKLPDRWEETRKWSKDRWIFHTDIELESIETGNLPVVEVEQCSMTEEDLARLTEYFAEGQELYVPQLVSKEVYQNKLERLQNMEGVYSVYTIDILMSDEASMLRKGVELAPPESELKEQKTEIRFGPRVVDETEKAIYNIPDDAYDSYDKDLFFSADVGKERKSHISASQYDPDVGTESTYEWMEGDALLYQKKDIDWYKRTHAQYADLPGMDQQWEALLEHCTVMMTKENINEEEGRKQAEALLEELGIGNKIYNDSEPVLWFPDGTYEDAVASSYYDSLWYADLEQAEPGYVYTFLNEAGGQPVDLKYGGVMWGSPDDMENGNTYAPSMPAETVSIAVTRSGVKMFSWTGRCREVSTVAENVKLLSFEKMQERIVKYVSYLFPSSQPMDNPTLFRFDLENLTFGYTYIPAYENPAHAWMVPAWFLELRHAYDDPELDSVEELSDGSWLYLTFNAMDGGIVEMG